MDMLKISERRFIGEIVLEGKQICYIMMIK